jgi:hypothetical protein
MDFDPTSKPFYKVAELSKLGFGDPKTLHAAITRGEIPVVRVGRKILIPTAWVRRQLQLDAPAAS